MTGNELPDGDAPDTSDTHTPDHDSDRGIPEWVADTAEHISECIDYRWNCHTEWCYVLPDDNQWGVHLIELAPAPLELTDREDAVGAFRLGVEQLDLLAMQGVFDEVNDVSFRQPEGPMEVSIQGAINGNDVRIVFRTATPPQPQPRR